MVALVEVLFNLYTQTTVYTCIIFPYILPRICVGIMHKRQIVQNKREQFQLPMSDLCICQMMVCKFIRFFVHFHVYFMDTIKCDLACENQP